VPVVGDAFSFWFKSNARNHRIIKEHTLTGAVARRSDWIFVIAVLVVLVAIVCLGLVLTFLFLQAVAEFLSGRKV
jgi:hypothetical protein